ncbi:hypothetical protein DesyoDRAFT_5169 [Desulfosporosinus youngiae DSM 17734]|uniref:Uncharacterized protein n=1 Tax=Desulfosporosinus youngiae DSM 17734 TaxID=768710 RepID=H5Y0C2_9FIRM|nr:hypothetical protein DesyoDRAFT_5169 [Desulfosporosinus youngiae DSM 17734]
MSRKQQAVTVNLTVRGLLELERLQKSDCHREYSVLG